MNVKHRCWQFFYIYRMETIQKIIHALRDDTAAALTVQATLKDTRADFRIPSGINAKQLALICGDLLAVTAKLIALARQDAIKAGVTAASFDEAVEEQAGLPVPQAVIRVR